MTITAGYSGTPLPTKLGLKDGQRVCFVNLPEGLGHLRDSAAFAAVEEKGDWQSFAGVGGLDVIHGFTTSRRDLEAGLAAMMAAIRPAGMIWVSWPKKASKVPTDITEDTIREICLPIGLVDVKVCAVDEIWSGLKLMIRKDRR